MQTVSNTSKPRSIHSTPTRILAIVAWTFCGALSLNLVLTGTAGSIWQFLPWLLFIVWGIFALLWRPCLLIRTDGLTIRNIARDHDVPFNELIALRVIQNVSFDTTAGRIPSWGAPGAGKLGPKISAGTGAIPQTQAAVQAAWDAWENQSQSPTGPERKVRSGWNVPSGVVGVMLLVLCILSVLS